jgi:hypothetical protein
MTPLPTRIIGTMEEIDKLWEQWYQTSDLHGPREFQNKLVILLSELAGVIKTARNRELGSYSIRRWKQATRLLDHKSTGMTAKESEETAIKETKAERDEENEADADFEGLKVLQSALVHKIQFCQDVSNDIKALLRMSTNQSS